MLFTKKIPQWEWSVLGEEKNEEDENGDFCFVVCFVVLLFYVGLWLIGGLG
jgi:hypothetical protein